MTGCFLAELGSGESSRRARRLKEKAESFELISVPWILNFIVLSATEFTTKSSRLRSWKSEVLKNENCYWNLKKKKTDGYILKNEPLFGWLCRQPLLKMSLLSYHARWIPPLGNLPVSTTWTNDPNLTNALAAQPSWDVRLGWWFRSRRISP